MSKRSFNFNTSSLATAPLLLEAGIYAGTLVNAAVTMGSGNTLKQTIDIRKEKVWDGGTQQMVETDRHIVTGWLSFGVLLTSKKAIKTLQKDEPRVYGGMINLSFDKETYMMQDNHVLGSWLQALELHDINFDEGLGWEYDENIEVPEELSGVANIVEMLNALAYYRLLFTTICNTANNTPVAVKVVKAPNYQNPEILENVIDRGTRKVPFCGILGYTSGLEEDLDDE